MAQRKNEVKQRKICSDKKANPKKLSGIYLVGLDSVVDEGVAVETAETVHGVVGVEADAAQLAVLTL